MKYKGALQMRDASGARIGALPDKANKSLFLWVGRKGDLPAEDEDRVAELTAEQIKRLADFLYVWLEQMGAP